MKTKNSEFNITINEKILKTISVIESRRATYRSNYFWLARVKINSIFTKEDNKTIKIIKNREGYSDIKVLSKYFLDSSDKINACFYHMNKLIEEENWLIENGQKVAFESEKVNPNPGILCAPLESINYELEAFFLQAYSSLEIFSKGIGFIFKNESKFHTIETILSNFNNDAKAKKILEVFNNKKYSDLINEFKKSGGTKLEKSRRDYLSHLGMLPMCQINIPLNSNTNLSVSMLPSHINQYDKAIKTKDYIESLFYLLCDFLIEILEIIFDIKIKPGRKTNNLTK